MPDMYAPGEYDLAGFIVGSVMDSDIVDNRRSSRTMSSSACPRGLHTSGFSLPGRSSMTGDLDLIAVAGQPLPEPRMARR